MSIKLLAKDLYRYQQEVERLERELASAPADKKESIAERLRQTKADRDLLRRALDGEIGR
jgi:uncharacterized protein (UPF0335 family)